MLKQQHGCVTVLSLHSGQNEHSHASACGVQQQTEPTAKLYVG